MPHIGNVERSVFLNPARLQCDRCDMEPWVSSDANGIELRGVTSLRDSCKCARQTIPGRRFLGLSKASSRAGTLNPHEVPARMADHGIENRRRNLLYKRPFVAYRFPERIQPIGQDAPLAQENGVAFHACALLDASGASTLPEPDLTKIGAPSSRPLKEDCLSGCATE
jgi:hypothetical protein